jgi:hypothetical protein
MIWPQQLLANDQRLLNERNSLRVIALCVVKFGQSVETVCNVGMLKAKDLLPDG